MGKNEVMRITLGRLGSDRKFFCRPPSKSMDTWQASVPCHGSRRARTVACIEDRASIADVTCVRNKPCLGRAQRTECLFMKPPSPSRRHQRDGKEPLVPQRGGALPRVDGQACRMQAW